MHILRDPKVIYWVLDPCWGALYYLAFQALRLMPCRTASALGAWLGLAEGMLRKKALLPRVGRCLIAIRPDLPASRHVNIYRDMWRNVGRVHAEMAVIDRLWRGARITVANAQVLRDARLSRRPIVFTFVHLGNWELLAVAVQREGITLNVVYENLRNRFESRLAEQSRRKLGYRLLAPTRSGVRAAYAALQRGEAVALAVDEYKAGNVIAPSFGRTLSPSTNLHYALRLARRFNALILPGYCLRTSPQAFVLTFLEPLVDSNLSQLNALSESYIRAHLDQWYMLWRILPQGLMQSKE